ncbi:DUF554 domain-containing protein [Vibrio furnissii]|uniref:DUF554 domain-containing protein n=1 Tax=Vibrio furnissii TaxID=29494 RepID=UPI001302CC3C|nr:DUF554 domain-containing protein [Vibrio furnissii]MCG6232900.1 DUF554 domain-containing protein [Vibrio furnissii]MCG6257826.1 DUF554 domain-containing protein [Vibrio furnissii]MCG6267360.1 DUF554 domain-containing protein [Vibrio furnissii]UHJ63089.1 DUF554 domain-containing protein [Vibrio furnissii]
MIGPFINGAAVIIGGAAGSALGNKVSERVRNGLPMIFGLASMGLGLAMVGQVKNLSAVILAILIGAIIGEAINLESHIQSVAGRIKTVMERFGRPAGAGLSQEEYMEKFIAILVLLCASGTGVFGSMNEGMTGDPTMLIIKAFLDLCTAGIFAISLGLPVMVLAIPQFIIQALLYFGAASIMPMTNPMMIADFSAVGGLIMFATGFRIAGIKSFAIANMLPALFLAMPISYYWVLFTAH